MHAAMVQTHKMEHDSCCGIKYSFFNVYAMMEYKTLLPSSSIGMRLLFCNTYQACRVIVDSFSSKEPSKEPLVYRAFRRIRCGRQQPSIR